MLKVFENVLSKTVYRVVGDDVTAMRKSAGVSSQLRVADLDPLSERRPVDTRSAMMFSTSTNSEDREYHFDRTSF